MAWLSSILAEISHQAGQAGLVIILDEVRRPPSQADMRRQASQNVRQIVDSG